MKEYRIYYSIPGTTHKKTPCAIVKAATIDDSRETFHAAHTWATIVAIFKA